MTQTMGAGADGASHRSHTLLTPTDVAGAPAPAMQSEQLRRRIDLADSIRTLTSAMVTTAADAAALARAQRFVDAATAELGIPTELDVHRSDVGSGRRRTANPFDSAENPLAPPLQAANSAPGEYVAEMTLSPAYEGPPGRVHGGVVTGILDHASGFALKASGIVAMSVSLTIELHDATPYGEPLTVTARVDERNGRKIWVTASLATADGHVTATCRTLMIELADPPAWAEAMYTP